MSGHNSFKFHNFQETQVSFPLLTIQSIWNQQLHRFCHPNFCVERRAKAELCMTERMWKYLDRQNAFSQEYGLKDWFKGPTSSSDLACLERALAPEYKQSVFRKAILTELGIGGGHRLRFKEQKTLAKNYLEKVIASLDEFCGECRSIWGLSPSGLCDLFQKKFGKLYKTEESKSLVAPYRLYDLCSEKYSKTWMSSSSIKADDIRWKEKLSLLFAMLKEDGSELTSIDELVARFEFYKKFAPFVARGLGLPKNAKETCKELITKRLWRSCKKILEWVSNRIF